MTTNPRLAREHGPSPVKLGVQRIRVNTQGYDRGGSYWGAGQDVFIVTTSDGAEEVTLRARNAAEARQKAIAQLGGSTGTGAAPVRERIGGHPTRKSRVEFDWRNTITGAVVRLRITHARDYLSQGSDHIEIESIAPARAPLPITETGYRSHFIKAEDLAHLGGVRRFVEGWLAHTAASKEWQRSQQAAAQGDLFQWAAAKSEATRKRARPAKPPAKPQRKPAKDRTPE